MEGIWKKILLTKDCWRHEMNRVDTVSKAGNHVVSSNKAVLKTFLNSWKNGGKFKMNPMVFLKKISPGKRWNCFLVIFHIIISYIFSEYFIEISSAFQKIWRFSSSICQFVNYFCQFFGFFDNFLLNFWQVRFQFYWKDTRTQKRPRHISFSGKFTDLRILPEQPIISNYLCISI